MPEAMSLSIMTSFRSHLSTRAPAKGLARMYGSTNENPTRARAVATPVFSQAQMVRANWVMLVPRNEISWPNQTTVNPRIPERYLSCFMWCPS